LGLDLTHQERYTLVQSYDKKGDFKMNMEDFYNAMAAELNKN